MTRRTLYSLIIAGSILGYYINGLNVNSKISIWGVFSRPFKAQEKDSSQRKIIQGKDKKSLAQMPEGIEVANIISKDWEKKLVNSLNGLSKKIKKIDVEQEKSLTWILDGNALMVESVKVILIDDKNEESSFRALVDPQTGKILETWDRSISDCANPRVEFKLRLDSRYQ